MFNFLAFNCNFEPNLKIKYDLRKSLSYWYGLDHALILCWLMFVCLLWYCLSEVADYIRLS